MADTFKGTQSRKTALVMLGCPQLCAQTSGALFLLNELTTHDLETMVADMLSRLALRAGEK